MRELGDGALHGRARRTEEKRAQIDAQIRDLTALRATLDELIRTRSAGKDTAYCPNVETLAGERPRPAGPSPATSILRTLFPLGELDSVPGYGV